MKSLNKFGVKTHSVKGPSKLEVGAKVSSILEVSEPLGPSVVRFLGQGVLNDRIVSGGSWVLPCARE